MAMNPQDFELIALGHVLARYRLTGELPTINGKPFNLNEFKSQLFAGTNYNQPDIDVNINIDKVEMENTVVDCDDHNKQVKTSAVPESAEVTEASNQDTKELAPESEPVVQEKPSIGGKLFQFFTKDGRNESQ